MRRTDFVLSLSAALSLFVASSLNAATDTANFRVTITILAACEIVSTNGLDFGSHGTVAADVDAETTLSVQCTNTTPYFIRLDEGAGVGATVAQRLMTGPASETIAYSLYTDGPRADVWGDTPNTDAVAGVGNGAAVSPVSAQTIGANKTDS